MMVIQQDVLKNNDGVSSVSGVIFCKGYQVQLTKNGAEYIVGELLSGVSIAFKAWSQSAAFKKLRYEDLSGKAINIVGKFDNYNGVSSIVLDTVVEASGYTPDQFLSVKYDIEAYWGALVKVAQGSLSKEAYAIADKVLFSNPDVSEQFKLEFAASSYHDNCKGGLLAHTYKVMSLMRHVLAVYRELAPMSDLLYLGALLHDIGKVQEMRFGNYQPSSVVTHRYIGVEMLSGVKDDIVSQFGMDWWLHLVSILLQHHDEYGDPCRSVVAWVVHRVDNFDSDMTLLAQSLDTVVDGKLKLNGTYLYVAPEKGVGSNEG